VIVSRRAAKTIMSDGVRRHSPSETPSAQLVLCPALRFRYTLIRKFPSDRENPNTLTRRQT
jgi:hypothetical protein